MPTCKECGFVASRLQWTHFKYNCTGRFKNGREYKAVYPEEILVDPELAAKTAVTLQNLVKKYGKEVGEKKWQEYKDKQALSNTFEYKAKKHGWSKTDFDQYNQSRSATFENFVKRYGEKEALNQWNQYCERQRYTNSLEYFIEKYGNDGLKKWNEYCAERGKSMSLEFIMEKYEVDFSGAEEILSDRYKTNFSSNLEKHFVDKLIEKIGDIKYTYKTKQFCIWSYELGAPLFYDITCSKRNKIIEFNGDYWHANPAITESNTVIKQNGLTAQDIWNRDKIKHNTAINRGFDVLVVWESEFKNDKQKTIDNTIKWWNK